MNTTITKTQPSKLPDGWKWVKLGDVCEKVTTRDPRKDPQSIFIYVDISSVDRITKKIVAQKDILGKDAPSRARKQIQFNDVIVSTTRPNLNAVALVPLELDRQICSTGFCVLRPQNSLNSEYLLHCVSSKTFVNKLSSLVVGALYPAVTDKQIFSQMIPFPPLDEQKRIAAKLNEQMDTVWEARKEAEEQLQAAKVLPSAYLKQVFLSNEDDLPNGWKWVKLGEVANFFDRMRKPVNEPERRMRILGKKEPELFPYYGANGQLGWIDDFIFDFPAILLAEDGGHFGSSQKPVSYIVNGKYWVNNHAHVIRPKDGVDLEYLHYSIMIRPDLQTSGSTVPKLNQRMAREIILPLPPLEEQKWIATKLKKQMMHATELTEAIEQELDLIKALPASILKKTLAGEP